MYVFLGLGMAEIQSKRQSKRPIQPPIEISALDPATLSSAAELQLSPPAALPGQLSDRELQVIERVVAGLTNEQIAEQLEISKRTVDNHVSNILTKTDTKNRVAMVRWALQWGKVCLDEVNCCTLPAYKEPQQ
jgi:DNA-binding NarL/FixJ family response regulator